MINIISILCLFLLSNVQGAEYQLDDVKTDVISLTVPSVAKNHLVKKIGRPVIINCFLNDTEDMTLTWVLPKKISNRFVDVEGQQGQNLTLVLRNFQETDQGEYKCEAVNSSGLHASVSLFVKSTKTCDFSCGYQNHKEICIMKRYKCDGFVDCLNGSDESPDICGKDPCSNKIKCGERCFPKEWCCTGKNCTQKWTFACCPQSNKGSHLDGRTAVFPHVGDPHYNDITFIQTTTYTILGYAIIFLLIVTTMLVAICRINLQRASNNFRNINSYTTAYQRALSQELDLYNMEYLNHHLQPGLLVTYNINNGVQIVGAPVDPPPYSEIAPTEPRTDPPPPYRQNYDDLSTIEEDNKTTDAENET